MGVEIKYRGSLLLLPEIHCDCGFDHTLPDMDVYIGKGILKDLPQYIRRRNLGKKAYLVADNNTYEVAGRQAEEAMKADGFQVSLCIIDRGKEAMEPDDLAVGEVLLTMPQDIDFLVAVGSGSINDITRFVATSVCKPMVGVGTAASMDGYTSVVAPLLNRGIKLNKNCDYARILVCDIDIMKTAPYEMWVSGFGDVIGKYVAKADWILGNIVNGETYCPACADLVMHAARKCVDNIDEIRNRTDEGVRSLIEALILSGLTILIIGDTRPVASIEHNMSHYWEMIKLVYHQKYPMHGTSVGVATGYAIRFYEHFFATDLSKINKEEVKAKKMTRKQWEQFIYQMYTPKLGPNIVSGNPDEYIDWEEQERRMDVLTGKRDYIKKQLSFLPGWEQVLDMFRKLGAPIHAEEIGIDDDLMKNTLLSSKDYRLRYGVFKSANELGILEEICDKVLEDYRKIKRQNC